MANDWWFPRKEELLSVAGKGCPIYVYNEETLNETFFDLLSIDALDLLFYPVHANPHPKILRKAFELDVGFKCLSIDEITRILKTSQSLYPNKYYLCLSMLIKKILSVLFIMALTLQ